MSAARSRDLTIAIAGAAAVAVAAIGAALVVPPRDAFPPGSSYSTAADGTAAAFRTLSALGYRVRASPDPIPEISETPRSTLLVLAEPVEQPSEQDRRALRAFAARGGTVIATGCAGAMFFSAASAGHESDSVNLSTYRAAARSPLTIDAPEITMENACDGAKPGAGFQPLYMNGKSVGVELRRIGDGAAMWWASATPITNARISDAGNFDLLLNAAGAPGRTVLWDEYYHGQRRSLWSYTAGTPLRWGVAQVALVLALAAAAYARRREPVRARVVEPRNSPLEFVDTMASLYARASCASDAVAVAYARVRRLLLAATGQAATATNVLLAAAAGPRVGVSPDEIATLLEAARTAAFDSALPPDAALPLVQRMQTLAAAIQTGG
ncbi:MAG: DUF4350 domain-containing protein [Vicinamibacterales bacterium]